MRTIQTVTKFCKSFFFFLVCTSVSVEAIVLTDSDDNKVFIDIDDYNATLSPHEQWIKEMLQKISITGREAILDLGCKDGKGAAMLAQKVPLGKVIAIDSSQKYITQAKKRFVSETYSHLYFFQQDPQEISYRDEFDLVVTFSWFHVVKNQEALFKKIYTSLKPKGQLILKSFVEGNQAYLSKAIDSVAKTYEWKEYFKPTVETFDFVNPTEFEQIVKKSGFENLAIQLLQNHEIFVTKTIFFEWLRPWIEELLQPGVDPLVFSGVYERFAGDVLKAYLKYAPLDERGYIHVEDWEIQIIASK